MLENTKMGVSLIVVWENSSVIGNRKAADLTMKLCGQLANIADTRRCELILVHDKENVNTASAEQLSRSLAKQYDGSLGIRTVECSHLGYVDQKIAGVEAARFDIVVFGDCDCEYEDVWLDSMIAPIISNEADLAYSNVCVEPSDFWTTTACIYWFYPIFQYRPDKPFWIFFCSLAMKRKTYDRWPFPHFAYDRTCCVTWPRSIIDNPAVKRKAISALAKHPAPATSIFEVIKHAWQEGGMKHEVFTVQHAQKREQFAAGKELARNSFAHWWIRTRQIWTVASVPKRSLPVSTGLAFLRINITILALGWKLIANWKNGTEAERNM